MGKKMTVAIQGNYIEVLMPQISKGKLYTVIGYNWFDITNKEYNSCLFFTSQKEAIKGRGYAKIEKIDIEKLIVDALKDKK